MERMLIATDADLVVVGHPPVSSAERLILGSVSAQVARRLTTALLIGPAQ